MDLLAVFANLLTLNYAYLYQFLGRWYTVAISSDSPVEMDVDSKVAELYSSDADNVISLLFTAAMYKY